MSSSWRVTYGTALLFGSVLAVALAVALHSGDSIRYPDEGDYHQLAQNILDGRGFVGQDQRPTAFRPPGYPGVLALIYGIWNRSLAAKVFNGLCLLFAALAMYRCVGRLGLPGAWLVPALVLCYPLFFYAGSTIYPQVAAMALLALSVYLMSGSRLSMPRTLACGLVWGGLVLLVPAFLLLLPIPAAFILVLNREASRRTALQIFVLVGAAALIVTPWTARNYLRLGAPVLVSTNSGLNLLLGNSENSRPNSGVNVDLSGYMAKAEGLGEVERDAYFRNAALEWIRQHPAQALWLYVRKVVNYFNFRNELFVHAESSRIRDWAVAVTYYPLLLLALARLMFLRKYPLSANECLLYVLYFGNALLSAIFFTRIRFRIPFDMLLVGIVSVFLGRVLADIRTFRAAARAPANGA